MQDQGERRRQALTPLDKGKHRRAAPPHLARRSRHGGQESRRTIGRAGPQGLVRLQVREEQQQHVSFNDRSPKADNLRRGWMQNFHAFVREQQQ